jgi:hypothetical protein
MGLLGSPAAVASRGGGIFLSGEPDGRGPGELGVDRGALTVVNSIL